MERYLKLAEELHPYLDLLAEHGVLGATREEVADHLLRDAIAYRMMRNGLLRCLLDGSLPMKPRQT